jgi:urease accessory protein
MLAAASSGIVPRWDARLDLGFAISAGRTALTRRSHHGPLQVQRPFYPDGGRACHVYVLHPPGGLVGGDRLTIQLEAEAGAEAVLTTPAATKFYRTQGDEASQQVFVRVHAGGALEWLPQETIVFGGASAKSTLDVDVQRGGHFAGWEITCLGRPASGDRFERGRYVQSMNIRLDGRPVALERSEFEGGARALSQRSGLAGNAVVGAFVAVTERQELADRIRSVLPEPTETDLFSASMRRGVLVCRYLGGSAMRARSGFERAWTVLREALLGEASPAPRIWAT